jgi:thioesterase domain-containing protein
MAARYLEALHAVQPTGPYRLAGWSMGGVVAYEMARQLEGQVEQLAILDVPAPRPGEVDEGTLRAWFARDLAGLQGKPLPPELATLSADMPLPEAFARVQELGLLPDGLDFTAASHRFEIFRANLRRIERYTPQPYSGRLHLFRAEASHFDDPTDPTLGWGALAEGGVELHRLPGSHWAIVRPPAVEALAVALQDSPGK